MSRHLITSDASIRNIKPGDARKRLADGEGLHLLLFVKGGAHGWRLAYTHAGRRNVLSLGTYPATSLALARKKADEARRLLSEGSDPSQARKVVKADQARRREDERRLDAGLPAIDSFEAVAREWLEKVHAPTVSEGQAERTAKRMERGVFPWIGRRPIAAVKAPELLTCLRQVEASGGGDTAKRIRQACGQVFRYGIATGRCERDVAADLRDALAPTYTKHFAAITDPKRVGELLRAIDAYSGHLVTRVALQFAVLVFQRPGEVRKAEWAELDLDAALWTIPAEKMKRTLAMKANGPPHLVPLSMQAVAVLRELQPLTGRGRYVFPGLRTGERPMSDAAVLAALRRMGYPKDEMTGHGFRAMARTMLAERLGVDESVIEAQLAHAVKDTLGRAYSRTEFVEQRRTMMQTWADYLDRLRKGGEVVPLRGHAA